MEVILKGNTAKKKTYFAKTQDKPAMLYIDVAEKVKLSDGTTQTIWNKVICPRNTADYAYANLWGEEEVSRYVRIEGRIVSAPKTRLNSQNQVVAYNTIFANRIEFLDAKWPERDSNLPEEVEEAPEPAEVDVAPEDMPF